MKAWRNRNLVWIGLGVLSLAGPLALTRAQPPAPATETAAEKPSIIAFDGRPDRWVWLRKEGDTTILFTGGPNQQPVEISRGAGWREVALGKGACAVLSDSQVFQVGLTASAEKTEIARNGAGAATDWGGLAADGEDIYWLGATSGKLPFVPTASQVELHRFTEGEHTLVNRWPAGSAPGEGDVVGVQGGVAYVRIRRPVTTELVRFPLPTGKAPAADASVRATGGDPVRVAVEPGAQTAAILDGALYWTAPSEEASSDSGIVQVRVLHPGGESRQAADWVSGSTLALLNGHPHLVGRQAFRLTSPLQPAEVTGVVAAQRLASDGAGIVSLDDAAGPRRIAPEGR